jgi:hypothetical protein
MTQRGDRACQVATRRPRQTALRRVSELALFSRRDIEYKRIGQDSEVVIYDILYDI